MICKVCGRSIANEEANFCEYCGTSFRPGTDNKISEEALANIKREHVTQNVISGEEYEANFNHTSEYQNSYRSIQTMEVKDKTMSFGDWMLSYVLLFVPYLGIGFLLYWAFGKSTPPTKKNWARVMLVLMGIAVILFLGVTSLFGDVFKSDVDALLGSMGV